MAAQQADEPAPRPSRSSRRRSSRTLKWRPLTTAGAFPTRTEGNHRLALDDFGRAIKRDPDLTEAYHKRATTYNATGEFGRAVSDFDRALELNPSLTEAHYGRAVALVAMSLHFRAIEALDRAIELDPTNADYHAMRGMTHALEGNADLAVQDIDKAVELGFDDPGVTSTIERLRKQ